MRFFYAKFIKISGEKSMKKTVSMLLVCVLVLSLFTACGSSGSKQNVNVTVCDESGKPVAGVKVQACDDSSCMVADTDANGLAAFTISKNVVDVHILKVPAGFASVEDVFQTDASGNLTVTLKPAA